MKNKIFALTLAILLIFSTFVIQFLILSSPGFAQAGRKIVIDVSHGQVGRTRRTGVYPNLVANLTAWGFQVAEIKEQIDATSLGDASMLLMGAVSGKNLTSSEIKAIVDWFSQGSKTIFVGSDSDFGGGNYIIENSNKVLEALKSRIRAEPTQVLDPESNAAADYRVVANVVNRDAAVTEITQGVQRVLFHGPTILAGVRDNKWVPLETETMENVFWILKTSLSSVIVDQDLIPPLAHTNGQKGSFVILAVQKFAGEKGNGKIIVSGNSAGYDDYEPVFQWEYYGVKLDGPQLMRNLVSWGFKVESPPGFLEQYLPFIAAIVIVIIVVAAVTVYTRRRKKAP